MNFKFKPLEKKDIKTLFNWLSQPEMSRWYQESTDFSVFKKKFEDKITSNICYSYIVYFNNIPIGYIQYYLANKQGDGWWDNVAEGTVGIDQFIGNLDYIGRGHGTIFIKEFIEKIILTNSWVKKVIVDVDPENKRAIKCYTKVGFKEIGIIDTPDGKAILMEYF